MKKWLALGIILSFFILLLSLSSYFSPGSLSHAARAAAQSARQLAHAARERLTPSPDAALPQKEPAAPEDPGAPENPGTPEDPGAQENPGAPENPAAPKAPSAPGAGEAAEQETYDLMLDTCLGPMLYYSQHDSRWGSYLYGGSDPMDAYGCGPTAAAMAVNAFSCPMTPNAMADWAASNGYFSRGNGSRHGLIPGALSAFGLSVSGVSDRSPQNAAALLGSGHLLIALMGKGTFAESGHFILITQLHEDGSVSIADPNSLEHTMASWSLEQLMSELKKAYDSGGPLWAVSLP